MSTDALVKTQQAIATQEQQSPALNPNRDPYVPTTFAEAAKLAQIIAESGLAPKGMDRPQTIFVAMQMGAEVGLKPMQAVQNIAVINGRPSLWGDAALAVVMGHPAYEGHKEYFENEGTDKLTAVCEIRRKGSDVHRVTFSLDDARRAGLLNKDTYKNYTKRMLQMRARGFAIRDKFADALRGLSIAEEAMDMPPAVATEIAAPASQEDPKERELRIEAERLMEVKGLNQAMREARLAQYKGKLPELIERTKNWNPQAPAVGHQTAATQKQDTPTTTSPIDSDIPGETSLQRAETKPDVERTAEARTPAGASGIGPSTPRRVDSPQRDCFIHGNYEGDECPQCEAEAAEAKRQKAQPKQQSDPQARLPITDEDLPENLREERPNADSADMRGNAVQPARVGAVQHGQRSGSPSRTTSGFEF